MPYRIAILSRPEDRSPKVLALGLQHTLQKLGHTADIYYEATGMLGRIFPLHKRIFNKIRMHFRIRQKLSYYKKDRDLLQQLKGYDLLIFSECIPNAYFRGYYAIEELRDFIKKPIALYEVYYLGNSNTHTRMLQENNHHGVERYDWNFSVSGIAERQLEPGDERKWSVIGMNLEYSGLTVQEKKEFLVLVDFEQEGFEESRREQIALLKELGIKYISLEGRYPMQEIRELYKRASAILIQFPEAFGLPIAECLACGTAVLVRENYWAMSWRKPKQGSEEYYLPACFSVYGNNAGLKSRLIELKQNFHPVNSAREIAEVFLKEYPEFYYGRGQELERALEVIVKG
jgi:hypothetical protein